MPFSKAHTHDSLITCISGTFFLYMQSKAISYEGEKDASIQTVCVTIFHSKIITKKKLCFSLILFIHLHMPSNSEKSPSSPPAQSQAENQKVDERSDNTDKVVIDKIWY